jgi:DNA-directed RNA polymerase subunit H (RpoH/RPB5)
MKTVAEVYQARNTLMNLLERRGYDVSEYKDFSEQQVAVWLKDQQLDLLLSHKDGRSIFVKFMHEGRPDVGSLIDDLFKPSCSGAGEAPTPAILKPKDDLLVVTQTDLVNDTMTQLLDHQWEAHGRYVEVTSIPRLKFNVLDHCMNPKFNVLDEKETADLFKKYRGDPLGQLPEMNRHDPVAIALGLRPGQVVRCLRSSKTSMLQDFYRLCV